MNYNIAEPKRTPIDYDVKIGGRYGDMPNDMLVAKYEETDIGDEEDVYNDFARGELSDFRPVRGNEFAQDETRAHPGTSSGMLNLRYYGTRGTVMPNHSEVFTGFGGSEDAEHRVSTEPDMRDLTRQERARMRFVNFTADNSHGQMSSGLRSESKAIADQQKVFKMTRDRLAVFSTQRDCRRSGLSKTWRYTPAIVNQICTKAYGDVMDAGGRVINNKKTMLARKIIRDTAAWRAETSDADFQVMRYGQSNRRKAGKITANATDDVETDTQMSSSFVTDRDRCKAMGILMGQLVQARHDLMADGDIQRADDGRFTVPARKHADLSSYGDLVKALSNIATDADFRIEGLTMTTKNKLPEQFSHLNNLVEYNHSLPAHQFINAELMYKGVKGATDMEAVRQQIITDAAVVSLPEINQRLGKTAIMQYRGGGDAFADSRIEVGDTTRATHNYKTAKRANGDKTTQNVTNDANMRESASTQIRRPNHVSADTAHNDTIDEAKFYDNHSLNRHGGRLGTKYTLREVSRDGAGGSDFGFTA